MPRLDLTDEEARDLAAALMAQLHGMRVELSAAEVRQFKHSLRERIDRLEQVSARLARDMKTEGSESDDTTNRWAPAD
jgi:hypothetical protein